MTMFNFLRHSGGRSGSRTPDLTLQGLCDPNFTNPPKLFADFHRITGFAMCGHMYTRCYQQVATGLLNASLNQTGIRAYILNMVAGTGFEPVTYGHEPYVLTRLHYPASKYYEFKLNPFNWLRNENDR